MLFAPIKDSLFFDLKRASLAALLLGISFFMSACDEKVVLEDLDSPQSIEATVKLLELGLPAERKKEPGRGDNTWQVIVPKKFYAQSLKVIHSYSIPSNKRDSVEELTRSKGFAPLSREMSDLRIEYARSLQVERLLEGLPGVTEARVLLTSGKSDGLSSGDPSASAVIRLANLEDRPPLTREEIVQILVQAIEGLRAENISLTLSRVNLSLDLGGGGLSSIWEGADAAPTNSPFSSNLYFIVIGCLLLFLVFSALVFFRTRSLKANRQTSKEGISTRRQAGRLS